MRARPFSIRKIREATHREESRRDCPSLAGGEAQREPPECRTQTILRPGRGAGIRRPPNSAAPAGAFAVCDGVPVADADRLTSGSPSETHSLLTFSASRINFAGSIRSCLTSPKAFRFYRFTLGTDECSSSSFAKSGISGPRRGPGGTVLLGGNGRKIFTTKTPRHKEGAGFYHEGTKTR